MRVVVGGASGFLGSALVAHLRNGHDVVRLVRKPDASTDTSRWDPATGTIDQSVVNSADVVVNLSGEPIAHWPPTKRWKHDLVASRISATHTIAHAVAEAPRPPVLLSASAAGYYGPDRGGELLDESSPPGEGFVPDLVQDWEAATAPAIDGGSRVVFLRTGLPIHRSGGVLAPMLPVARLGLGAKLGDGHQYFPVCSLSDWCRAVEFVMTTDVTGPVNIASPDVPTNGAFTDALGDALHRPTFLRVPAPAFKAGFGSFAANIIGSIRLHPQRLLDEGFHFEHTTLESIVASALAD